MNALQDQLTVEPIPHRFGLLPGFPLGVEEELLLVDPATGCLEAASESVVARVDPPAGWITSEIFAAEIELVSPICRKIGDAAAALQELLREVRSTGAAVIGAGLHPDAPDGKAALCQSPRYEQVSESLQGLLRTPPAALHVHIGMPDPETAITAANGLRRHLPLLHSLGANSPYWFGRDSGLASARTAVLRSYPRYGVPRWFRDWEDFCRVAADLTLAADVPDYTFFWWDVRPHPRLGTIEVRAPDAQPSQERAVALAGFIHALAVLEAEEPPPPYESREAIEAACYQASRYGLEALLPDHTGERRPARELAGEMIRRAMPYARDLGADAELHYLEDTLRQGNGADLQRRIHEREGIPGVLRWLMAQR